jgi:prophage antirepressor-like protein
MTDLRTLANPFQFSDLDVRTAVDQDDQVWFCAKDVCQVLGIDWTSHTLDNMPDDWFMVVNFTTIKGDRDTYFINEPGLYRLIFRSNKPRAIEFSNWVCQEVLPTIRKNGFFGEVSSRERLAYSKQIVEITSKLTATKDAMLHRMLVAELRDCCNVVGRPMPDLTLLGKDYK